MNPAYMTATRSHSSATTPRSWVIQITAMPSSRFRSLTRSSSWACTVTSKAVVGSSAIRSRGLHDRAIAIITRCRMPPLNWNG